MKNGIKRLMRVKKRSSYDFSGKRGWMGQTRISEHSKEKTALKKTNKLNKENSTREEAKEKAY